MSYIDFFEEDTQRRPYKGRSILKIPNEYIVLDLETTGFSPESCEIIEFGGIKVINGKEIESLSVLICPKHGISQEITNITGIDNKIVKNAPSLEAVLPEILAYIGDSIIVGHNVNFDINFLYEASMQIMGKPLTNDFLDTMRLSKKLYPDMKHHRLSDLVKKFQVGDYVEHRALDDARQTLACLKRMKADMEDNGIRIKK
ncbi:MAG: 3'-5' exonuclease [Phascolarctobacterium sp.]|nr:3'-5' exonuclease [Phascolarctobacterium sp.]